MNDDLILSREILHKLGIIFQKKTSLGKKINFYQTPNSTAKNIFLIEESYPDTNATKFIKHISDAKYINIKLKN